MTIAGSIPPFDAAPPPAPRHNRADHFAKAILCDALGCASIGPPETEVEVVAAAQKIDVYATPDPSRAAERAKMGWLGELFTGASLFEPFSRTPNLSRIRRVIGKHHGWHHELERRAREAARARTGEGRNDDGEVEVVPFPRLVVISTGRPEAVLDKYGCRAIRPGWYEAVDGLEMSVIVLAELPRSRETLVLRLLGAGAVLGSALDDLAALPHDAWERSVSWPNLLKFGLASEEDAAVGEEGDDVSAEIRAWYETYEQKQQQLRAKERREAHDEGLRKGHDEGLRKGHDEGLRKGHDEGRAEEAARGVLTVLRVRGIAVSDAVCARITAERDVERLENWLERAAIAASLEEVFGESD